MGARERGALYPKSNEGTREGIGPETLVNYPQEVP